MSRLAVFGLLVVFFVSGIGVVTRSLAHDDAQADRSMMAKRWTATCTKCGKVVGKGSGGAPSKKTGDKHTGCGGVIVVNIE